MIEGTENRRLVSEGALAAVCLLLCCGCTTSSAAPSLPVGGGAAAAAAETTTSTQASAPSGGPSAIATTASVGPEQDALEAEQPEMNPYSEDVTLRLTVTPPAKAIVLWGAKQVAKLAPGSMEAEIVRPRGSGPLDLEIKADGYLPYHTRLYSDRDDKVSVRLVRADDASGLFGYRRNSNATDKKP